MFFLDTLSPVLRLKKFAEKIILKIRQVFARSPKKNNFVTFFLLLKCPFGRIMQFRQTCRKVSLSLWNCFPETPTKSEIFLDFPISFFSHLFHWTRSKRLRQTCWNYFSKVRKQISQSPKWSLGWNFFFMKKLQTLWKNFPEKFSFEK